MVLELRICSLVYLRTKSVSHLSLFKQGSSIVILVLSDLVM